MMTVRTKKAWWVTSEKMEWRHQREECFHCGQKGHKVHDCKVNLNKKKTRSKNDAQVSLIHVKKKDIDVGSLNFKDSEKE